MSVDESLLTELLEQEKRLVFPSFSNDTAIALGAALLNAGRHRHLAITVDVTRAGQQLFHAALPGTTADNDQWIIRKNAVVYRCGHSSYYMGRLAASKGVDFNAAYYLDPLGYSAHGGAFPINLVKTGLVGTATVSGLPQAEDHKLVVDVISHFITEHFPHHG